MNHAPRQKNSRKIFGSHAQIRITFVVLQADVVARAVLFNQVAFQNQRFDFSRRNNRLEVGDFRNHRFDFCAVIFAGLKILADAMFQHTGFADVNNFAANVAHEVNAGRIRQRLEFFFDNVQINHLLADNTILNFGGHAMNYKIYTDGQRDVASN